MSSIVSLLVLAAQRIPFVNRLSAVAGFGTLDQALASVTKSLNLVSAVAVAERAALKAIDETIEELNEQRTNVVNTADRAERVASRLQDLLA